jgi:cytochrome c556
MARIEARRMWGGAAVATALAMFVVSVAAQNGQQPPSQQPAAQQPAAQQPAGQQPPQQQPQPEGRGQRGQQPAPGTPAKPYTPLAASTFADHPDAYYGEPVTVTAAVEQKLSPLAFSVDQDKTKSTGKEVLVLAPRMNEPVELNTYITAIGEAVKFEPEEIAKKSKDIKIDLPPDAIAKYRGKPAILATAVINSAGLDVARRLPPPMTAEEQALQKLMLQIGPANNALRGAMDKSDAKVVQDNAQILKQAFTQTEAFWKARGKPDAVKWAQDARAHADSIDRAVVAGKWDEVKASAGTLAQQCAACHGAYRERFDDGSFRIKTGG